MMPGKQLLIVLAAAMLAANAASAQDVAGAVKARKAQMQLQAFNLGILAGMAQEKRPYDAATAAIAAANLAALAGEEWSLYFPEGSAVAQVAETRALPAIWEDKATFDADKAAFAAAAEGMAAVAGTGLAALKGAIGPLGGACGACHKANRAPE